jgi:hypothetical protein
VSYGFRPGKSARDALKCGGQIAEKGIHVVDADFQSYFDTIPHGKLMDRVREYIAMGAYFPLWKVGYTRTSRQNWNAGIRLQEPPRGPS